MTLLFYLLDLISTEGVSENTDLVYVSTSTGQLFAARRIVLAVPPSSTRNIDFSPPLPVLKKYLLDRMSMGSYLKFILSYEEAFWIQKVKLYRSFFVEASEYSFF